MSLKELLQGDTKLGSIKIKVISNHGESSIVGDASGLAICCASNNAFKNMTEGQCYTILKPINKDMNCFIPNEKLKPFKIANFPLTPKKTELSKLHALLQSNSEAKPTFTEKTSKPTTFKGIMNFAPKSEIKTIIVKILNISKDINGNYGTYNIAKVKDIDCEKMDINLYNRQLKNKMKVGDIFELKHIKITQFVKDGETFKRLVTTSRSSGGRCNSEIETLFKDVPLGDKKEEGKVVAVHDIFSYWSCSKCWKKTNEEDSICPCGNTDNIHVNDFHCQFYIETTKDNEIQVVHTFRRQTNLDVDTLVPEDIQVTLDDKYLNKIFTFEWNIITDEEELRMITIKENNQNDNKLRK